MYDDKDLDFLDGLLFDCFDIPPIEELPKSTQKVAQRFIRKVKLKNNIKKLNKVAIAVITIGIMTTGVVFAKDIVNFITSMFTNSTPAIDTAVQNGYVQNVNMDYVYDNDIGIKVDNLVIDDYNLDISFSYNVKDNNISSIDIDNFIISNENDDLIYESEHLQKNKLNIACGMSKISPTKQIDSHTYNESILFNLDMNRTQNKFNNIYIEIKGMKIITENNDTLNVEGNWKFDLEINEQMKNRNKTEYKLINDEDVEHFSAVMTETELVIELELKEPIESERFDCSNNFIIKNELNEEFKPYRMIHGEERDVTNSIESGKIVISYNNIGIYSENNENLKMILRIQEDQVLELYLSKID